MALSAARLVSLPYVEAALNFVTPETIRARNYNCEPPPGVPMTSARYDTHRAPIWDMRPIASRLTLDNSGFTLIRFTPHTAFADPAAPVKARPRESIELRTLLFFDGEEGTATQRA